MFMYMTPSTRRISTWSSPAEPMSMFSCTAGWSPVRSMAPSIVIVWPAVSIVMDTLSVVIFCAAAVISFRKSALLTAEPACGSAPAASMGADEDAGAFGSAAVAELPLSPHAASDPSARGRAAATAARRRVRVGMGPPGGSSGRAPLPMSGGRPPGVPDGSVSLTGQRAAPTRNGSRSGSGLRARLQGYDGGPDREVVQPASVGAEHQRRDDQADQPLTQQRLDQPERAPALVDPYDAEPGRELAERAPRECHQERGLADEQQVEVDRGHTAAAEPVTAVDQQHHAPAGGVVDEEREHAAGPRRRLEGQLWDRHRVSVARCLRRDGGARYIGETKRIRSRNCLLLG